jgi:16S rRNA (guanine1207-N2)-methyltransferase
MKQKLLARDFFADLDAIVPGKLRPPFGLVLGSPLEALDLIQCLNTAAITCFQMDLFQAQRLEEELKQRNLQAKVVAAADLWDLPEPVQTMIYPVPQQGERQLKIDMVEQAFHALQPGGTLVVISPFEKDQLFTNLLKKIFGRVHAPMGGGNMVLWAQRQGDRPRRRHEVMFQVRVHEEKSLRFVSRPGVFSFGKFDDGARILMDNVLVNKGDQVLDLGCGCGTNGILAAEAAGPSGHIVFTDSNLRACALAELNAKACEVKSFETIPSCTLKEIPEWKFDVVLANPPYYGQMSIAQFFIQAGKKCLKPGGRLYLVSKLVDQTSALMEAAFGDFEAGERRGYVVFEGIKSK